METLEPLRIRHCSCTLRLAYTLAYLSTKKFSFSGHFHAKSGISRSKVGQSPFSDLVSKKYDFNID